MSKPMQTQWKGGHSEAEEAVDRVMMSKLRPTSVLFESIQGVQVIDGP
jgi:hypothetical protein